MRGVIISMCLLVACSDAKYSVESLQDPNTCAECHPKHFQQWSGSMHAYAAQDPVFVAMNKRGQRETNGELGDFCVQCHAPMALELGEATGANFDPDALSPAAKGITCYFCHNVDKITEDHNNGLVIANDQTMRGGVKHPTDSPAHFQKYDEGMASKTNNSRMCGSCHDVVTPAGVHLERTYAEWQTTVFAIQDPQAFLPLTCSGCHMFASTEAIADKPGLATGNHEYGFHEHAFPGVDQALTTFPETDAQTAYVQRDLDIATKIVGLKPLGSKEAYGGICVNPDGTITVRIDSFSVGHMFPSGAAQDRRAWIETIAYDASNNVVFSSGVVPDDKDPEDINDPYVNCTMPGTQSCSGFWDRTKKADSTPAHFFWEVATVDSKLILPQTVRDPNAPGYDHSSTVKYLVGPSLSQVDHITSRLRMRALPFAVLDELVSTGDLDANIRGRLKTLSPSGAMSTWTRATAGTGLAENTGCNPF